MAADGSNTERDYAGDVSPSKTWQMLESGAHLIDVRTAAEWTYVGLPDLDDAMNEPLLIEWQSFPAMQVNAGFADALGDELERRGVSRDRPLLFLCRSGVRSLAAARAMTGRGWNAAYNIEGGFEGVPDDDGHRGRTNGWKAAGLPWKQG